jgi:dynein heavy chain
MMDYWEVGKRMLNDPNRFLESLIMYDRDHISDSIIKKIDNYMMNQNFLPSRVAHVSKACTSICMWVSTAPRPVFKHTCAPLTPRLGE